MCDAKFCGSPLDKTPNLAAANRMFVREKRINGYAYLYLVETVREGGRARQRIIKNLGRKEAVTASGALERLATSVAPARNIIRTAMAIPLRKRALSLSVTL